ncbi:MAG: STAS/SEC14 domain-containing protein [Candidatus Nitrotoga sp.]
MFTKIDSPDNVIAFALSDKLGAADMKQYESAYSSRLEKPGKLALCVDFTGLLDVSAQGAMEGAKADLELFRHIKRFKRFAVISDKEWPTIVLGLVKSLLPTLESRLFKPAEREQAVKWASETSTIPANAKGSMRLVKTSKAEVLAFEIEGVLTSEAVAGMMDDFNTWLAAHDKVRLMAHFKNFVGIDLSVLMQSALLSMKLEALKKLERYAVVGSPVWMTKIIEVAGSTLPNFELRTFDSNQEDDAWAWLDAKRV